MTTRFDVLSFKNSTGQELYSEVFPNGGYAITAHRNQVFTFEIAPHSSRGDSDLSNPNDAEYRQLVRVEVFWKPRPGATYADSSQTNANITYCLITGKDSITYEGAGFVYLKRSMDNKTITGQIESATLVPAHFQGEPADLFGPCHLKGNFVAREDRVAVTAIEQRLSRLRNAATTQPAIQ
ncbi:MAG: hypothetical protein AABZ08_07230 [Planctomycetota bacterium]